MRKTMNGHVLIMIDTDLPISKSHMLESPSEMDAEDDPGPGIVNIGKCRGSDEISDRRA